jgi:hypothetical protein
MLQKKQHFILVDHKDPFCYTIGIVTNKERNKMGLRFVEVKDFAPLTRSHAEVLADGIRKEGLVVHVYETFVTRKNMMSGKEYQERYDTPYYCSPSSESYFSM